MKCENHERFLNVLMHKGKTSVRCAECGKKSNSMRVKTVQEETGYAEFVFVPIKKRVKK